MATITFLWHLHQPGYRTADGVSHMPWVALHAGGAYRTLTAAINDGAMAGQVVNIVPSLLEQMLAYRDGRVDDPVINALRRPAQQLGDSERDLLLEWCFSVSGRQMDRFPRLRELQVRRSAAASGMSTSSLFGPGDLRDLQVLFILANAGEQAWRDEDLAELFERGARFSAGDHQRAIGWFDRQPGELIELWRQLEASHGVEIASSPFAHPIMPLLADTAIVAESWAPDPPPSVPSFAYPDDARWQLDEGLQFMRDQGFEITGCWPPEGSVSLDALEIYHQAGVRWLVADEGILDRSLGRSLRRDGAAGDELYRPWRPVSPSPILFFRDRELSDRIGFTYGNWDNEAAAAADLVDHLVALADRLPDDAAIVIALDGENAWLHYPEAGGTFLRELMERLTDAPEVLRPATLAELTADCLPRLLPKLHPGSWINSVFATWIGHPEKTQAWRVLAAVRTRLESAELERPPALLLAEGSDWFWWLGDDNPNPQAPLFDRLFRRHLEDACTQAGIEAPPELDRPIKTLTTAVRVPVSERWRKPHLDGRIGSYFEWVAAASIEGGDDVLRRVKLRSDREMLHLLIEACEPIGELLRVECLQVHLLDPDGGELRLEIDHSLMSGENWAVDRVAELSLPWTPKPGYRLQIALGPHQIPHRSSVLLEPFPAD